MSYSNPNTPVENWLNQLDFPLQVFEITSCLNFLEANQLIQNLSDNQALTGSLFEKKNSEEREKKVGGRGGGGRAGGGASSPQFPARPSDGLNSFHLSDPVKPVMLAVI